MKKLLLVILTMVMLLSITACSARNADTSLSLSKANYNEEQQNIINLFNTADTLELSHIEIELSEKLKSKIVNLLNIENWARIEEQKQRDFTENFMLIHDDDIVARFFDKTVVHINNGDDTYREYLLPKETINDLLKITTDIINDSIQNGNTKLENDIYEFKDLVIDKYDNEFDFSEKNLLPLTAEEIAPLLKVKEWKLYTGTYETVRDNHHTPFELRKSVDDYYRGLNMLLQIKEYDDLFIAKCNFIDGPGGQTIFEIPQEVYWELIAFKESKLN